VRLAGRVSRTSFPNRFYWTGGAFLRWDWLFYFVGGVCLVRKRALPGRRVPGLLGAAARVSRPFCLVGPPIVVVQQLLGERAPGRPWWSRSPSRTPAKLFLRVEPARYVRFFAGLALISALLVPREPGHSNGIASYREFYKNSQKHKQDAAHELHGPQDGHDHRPSEWAASSKNDKLEERGAHGSRSSSKTRAHAVPAPCWLSSAFVVLLWRAPARRRAVGRAHHGT